MNDLKFKLIPEKDYRETLVEKGIHPKNKPTNKYAPRTRLSKKFDDISPLFQIKSPNKIKKKLTLSPLSFKNK
mgnify:CR=1 FL=1